MQKCLVLEKRRFSKNLKNDAKNVKIVENFFFFIFFETSMISLSNDSTNSIFQCFIRKILNLQKKCNFQSESQSAFEPKKFFEILFYILLHQYKLHKTC
jgi:hypothetical protein